MRAFNEGENVSIQSSEVIEAIFPLRVIRNAIREGSGGAGQYRGGCGLTREVEVMQAGAYLSVLSDRNIIPPAGVNGGYSGAPNRYSVRREGQSVEASAFPGKIANFPLEAGDVVVMESSGGGGWGDPADRDAAAVADDLADGYISDAGFVAAVPVFAQAAAGLTVEACRLHPDLAAQLHATPGAMLEVAMRRGPCVRLWLQATDPALGPNGIAVMPGLELGEQPVLRLLRGEGPGMSHIVGIDVGGTFTDLVLYDGATASVRTVKVPSVRDAPDEAVLAALDKVGVAADAVALVVHGTTVATNALLERRGARCAFVTTEGFRDVLELGRTTRLVPNTLYDPYFRRPAPLIRRRDRHTLKERVAADGSIVTALFLYDVEDLARHLAETPDIEAVAIGFLNSFRNPAHEQAARDIFARYFPCVSISSDVLNEIREFDRFSATAINVYVMPVMRRYVGRLTAALAARNPRTAFYTMASHGGLLTSGTVASHPVRTILSGPAAGVMATVHLMRSIGVDRLITYDMGGTSTDVALVADGRFPLKRETILEGLVVHLAQLDIHTIGAGGGSIAALDAGGALQVGPESAGAVPGPACYGRGGTRPTVTDANVALGRLGDDQELGGSLSISRAAAEAAIEPMAREAGLSVAAMAEAVLKLAVAKMTAAVHEISVARGFDPRDFALLSYGGAGPLHACLVAEEIGIPRVIVPPAPGAFSAFGALCSALMKDRSATLLRALDEAVLADALAQCGALAGEIAAAFAAEGIAAEGYSAEYQFDMRYQGQAHELTVTVPAGAGCADVVELFERDFERAYGRRDLGRAVEIVTLRVLGRVPTALPRWTRPQPGHGRPVAQRHLIIGGAAVACPVFVRAELAWDQPISGPAIIEEMSATVYLPPGWEAAVGGVGELDLRRCA